LFLMGQVPKSVGTRQKIGLGHSDHHGIDQHKAAQFPRRLWHFHGLIPQGLLVKSASVEFGRVG
jgi:hypothetical protein